MDDPPVRRIGLPWYRREDYAPLRDAMADAHILASTYEGWLAAALNNETVARQAGLDVVRVVIDPDVFAGWCAARGRAADAGARVDYVREAAAGDDGPGDRPIPPSSGP
ncbi:MAG: hypothetical protein ABW026_12530 [Microvirga sp.]